MIELLGGEPGCKRLSAGFYTRVAKDPDLRRLFPGKTHRCAIEEFAAFLIQFLGGNEELTQYRWWLSLRESHARFKIGSSERDAWLKQMGATLDSAPLDEKTKNALKQFFSYSSAYIVGGDAPAPEHEELAGRWAEQRALDDLIGAIIAGRDTEVMATAPRFASRPSVFVGILARMVQSGREPLVRFVVDVLERDPRLGERQFAGRTLLHFAAGGGCLAVVSQLLSLGIDPNLPDRGGHTALYHVANECGNAVGPEIVRELVRVGADINHGDGVTRSTPLHMAARRGHVGVAEALLDCGASLEARDAKGNTPLDRAMNCRKHQVGNLLMKRGVGAGRAGRKKSLLPRD